MSCSPNNSIPPVKLVFTLEIPNTFPIFSKTRFLDLLLSPAKKAGLCNRGLQSIGRGIDFTAISKVVQQWYENHYCFEAAALLLLRVFVAFDGVAAGAAVAGDLCIGLYMYIYIHISNNNSTASRRRSPWHPH